MQLDSGIYVALAVKNIDALGNLYQTYATFYFLQDNIEAGYYFSFKYDSIIKSINLKDLNFYTKELETIYSTEKKETQIQLQQAEIKQKNLLNYILIGSIIVILSIVAMLYKIYKNRQYLHLQHISELEKEKQLHATESILKIQEDERSRIAKDLHDGLGGLLSSVKYSLNDMKENLILKNEDIPAFKRSIDMLDTGIQELRRIAHNMMPENLIKFGLDVALKDYCKVIDNTKILTIHYTSFQRDNFFTDQNITVTIYRIIQELINNTIKHANASELLVQLSNENKILHITVEDNGKGLDVNSLSTSKGAGWSNINNRLKYLNGTLDINSNPKEGTSINIEIPII